MQLPIFFTMQAAALHESLVLDEDTSRHVSQVLRMRAGEQLQLADGNGTLLTAAITDAHKKHSAVKITAIENVLRNTRRTSIAISLLKNANRFEWFLEKATELGIQEIIPLICERTERQHFRLDRMKSILISAMLQSRQAWLPVLSNPVPLNNFINEVAHENNIQKLVAHCMDDPNKRKLNELVNTSLDALVLIGPEGDFTAEEINLALQYEFIPVSLGNTRLRTETAGIVAASWLV